MSRLRGELLRLYLPHGSPPPQPEHNKRLLLCSDGRTRTGVLSLARPADWGSFQRLWQLVQADMGLPAPGIAVNGVDGYQLWFSLHEPVPKCRMSKFLSGLRMTYLGEIATRRIAQWPEAQTLNDGLNELEALCVPAPQGTDRWSAFVSPDLASIFSEDPWLDINPADASQADVLAALKCARPDIFDAAFDRLVPAAEVEHASAAYPQVLSETAVHQDPEAFLLRVMNDPSVAMSMRIEAALALLPLSIHRNQISKGQ